MCNGKCTQQKVKVREDDHRTAEYRGAAHTRCNITNYCNRFLPAVQHLRGYDSHLVIKEADNIYNKVEDHHPDAPEYEHYIKKFNITIIRNSYQKNHGFSLKGI